MRNEISPQQFNTAKAEAQTVTNYMSYTFSSNLESVASCILRDIGTGTDSVLSMVHYLKTHTFAQYHRALISKLEVFAKAELKPFSTPKRRRK